MKIYQKYFLSLLLILFIGTTSFAQLFPNPTTLSTGQGSPGTTDPIWTCSEWFSTQPTDASGATFIPSLINNTCAPGSWVDPSSLPAPMDNGNWITGQDANCANNSTTGYRFFRLELNLPEDCNGYSVTQQGNYVLTFNGYVDNLITDVFLNDTPLGISGGGYSPGSQLTITIDGPWQVGINYIDILVYNVPGGGSGSNPYGLLLVSDANSLNGSDTDGDNISDLFDQCPCDPGNNPVGCIDPEFSCDLDMIRDAFTDAGCEQLDGCSDDCSIYFLNPQYLSGNDAQAFAQTLGANLISVQSAEENECILSDLNRLGYDNDEVIWIGFNDEAVEGQFEWYDQSPINYTNWAPGEPNQSGNEDCVQIYPGGSNPGTWNDLNCDSYNSMSIIEVNLCPITDVTPPITICQEEDTTIKVISTILGSSPYSYVWDNNTTQTSQSVAPMDTTSYYVTTKDRYNCQVKDTVVVQVNDKPTAEFSNDAGCQTDKVVSFTNESSTPGNGALTYNWNFGNGQTGTTKEPQNTFPSFGNQTVSLIVTSPEGCKDTIEHNLSVLANPVAAFTFDSECNINPEITFQNTSSSPDNSTLTSNWDFGNNQTDNTTSPTVTLPNPSGNSVTLIVTTPDNCKDTIVEIVDANVLPIAGFDYTPDCENEVIGFTNTSTIAGNNTLDYQWDLGNGETSTQPNSTATYGTSGSYPVTLIATASSGCADTIVKNATVYPIPNAPVITSNSPVECPGDIFTFSGNAINGASYFWSGPQNYTSNDRTNTLVSNEGNQGDYSLYIEVNGCPSEPSYVNFKIEGKLVPLVDEFPNIITPNGDGINDHLDINEYFSSCLPFKIEIFNRWGNRVWVQESEGDVFQGKDQQSGVDLTEGVYFYKLTYGDKVRQGNITIIR